MSDLDPVAALASIEATSAYGFWGAFVNSLAMIIATELGDKTFFIAAILAMQFERTLVFVGAIGALAVMTVLSAGIGFALPNLLPRLYTHYAAVFLFVYFGFKLLKDAKGMQGGTPSEELQEVEDELTNKKREDDVDVAEQGGDAVPRTGLSRLFRSSSSMAVLTEAFTLTFLAEWGDRSQIATIALAAAKDPYGVTLGGILGHALCTGLAVIGGRLLASRLSEKTVAIFGGCLFIVFAIHSFFAGPDL